MLIPKKKTIMNNQNEIPYPGITQNQSLKWQEPFNDLLDEIYFNGYAADLILNDPQEYSREYFYFMALYD